MRIELSWKNNDGQHKSFTTGCPQMAEAMMRSSSDFPQATHDIKAAFQERYGKILGSFESLLRTEIEKRHFSPIETDIPGLTVSVRRDEDMGIC